MASHVLGLVLAAAVCVTPLRANTQIPSADEAVFVVRANGQVVGSEEIALRRVADAAGRSGLTLSVINEYPHTAAIRTFVRFGPRRVTIRIATIGNETAREYPNRPGNLLGDEWVLGLYALAAGTAAGPITVVYPRTGTSVPATLEDAGQGRTTVGDKVMMLRHVVLHLPDDSHDMWYDTEGRLMKVVIPSRKLVAERQLR